MLNTFESLKRRKKTQQIYSTQKKTNSLDLLAVECLLITEKMFVPWKSLKMNPYDFFF